MKKLVALNRRFCLFLFGMLGVQRENQRQERILDLKLLSFVGGVILVLAASPCLANRIPSVTASTNMGSGFATDIQTTVNGVGLSSLSLTALHDATIPTNSWVSAGPITGTVTFDLGGTFAVDSFSFWNQNGGGPGAGGSTGIQGVAVSTSTDGITFTALPGGPNTFAQVPGANAPPQIFKFSPVGARFFRFTILSNYGDTLETGFAEVGFNAAAPDFFVIDDVNKNEGQTGTTPFTFTVTRLGITGFPAVVQYQTIDGTATAASGDYQAASGTLNFGNFETSKTLTVLVNGDTVPEPNETFTVHILYNPVNGAAQDADGQGLIVNDDPGGATPVPTPTPTPPNRFEGDINRTAVGVGGTGDGDVNVADQIQYLKFLNGTDCPTTNEQPRLDAGPRTTFGDGVLGSADGTAIDAYARHDASTDFDPNTPGWQPTPVGGPATISNLGCTPPSAPAATMENATVEAGAAAWARVVRVVSRSGSRNSDVTVDIEMAAQGNEAGTQFGLHFDPSALRISGVSGVNTNPDITPGAGVPEGVTLNVNADDAANGNIGIVENFNGAAGSISGIPAGVTRIARVRFHVLDGASGTSRVDFDTSVINGVTSDVNGMVLSANYEGGDVSVTASRGVTVLGRVTSSDGRGIRGATVTIVDGDGLARTATTSSFGYYTFDDVIAATYTIGVASRQYRFGSRTITVGDNLANVDFTGLE